MRHIHIVVELYEPDESILNERVARALRFVAEEVEQSKVGLDLPLLYVTPEQSYVLLENKP